MESISALDLDVVTGHLGEIAPRLIAFYRYWNGARGGKSMPARSDVDPIDIPKDLLPNLFLVEVVDGGRRFKFRLAGTESTIASGRPMTGFHVDEVTPNRAYAEYVSNLYRRVMARKRPVLSVSNFGQPKQEHRVTQRIMCPLSPDEDAVTMVISCQIFDVPPHNWQKVSLTSGDAFEGLFEAVVV
jgi:hypothetical protein